MKSPSALEDIDWSALNDAYGTAVDVPGRLRALSDPEPATRRAALTELWGTVWHQGTVYDCTPLAVPFLADVVVNASVDVATRAEVAVLLASIASANSFVLQGQTRMSRPEWWPDASASGGEASGRDLAEECRVAVANELDQLGPAFTNAPREVRAGLLAVFATVAEDLPASIRVEVRAMQRDPDRRLVHGGRLTSALAAGREMPPDEVARLAAVDPDVADYLNDIRGLPPRAQMVEIARELCCAAISQS